MKKTVLTLLLVLMILLSSFLILTSPVKAQESVSLTIKPDGSVEPSTNLLERNGTTYTFKGDIFDTIWVQTNNITIDGAGYALQGNGINTGQNSEIGILLGGPDLSNRECSAVLVKNLKIYNIPTGVFSVGGSNNSFIGNYLNQSSMEIQGNANGTGDLIKQNTLVNATVLFNYNPNGTDIITENNFVNTTIALWLSNAPVVDRNYWGDYQTRYPNATEIDNTGIGDTPYVYTTVQNGSQTIKYQDNYPLINKLSTLHISTDTFLVHPKPFTFNPRIFIIDNSVVFYCNDDGCWLLSLLQET